MAPLPSTLDEETTALIDNLDRRKKDLLDFQIPRLRDCKGPLVTQQQYAAELHDDVDTFARLLETLDVSVDDQKGERNRMELRRIVDEYQETLMILRKETRSAVLTSKRAIDANRQSNREELLRSSAVREKQNLNEKVAEDALMKTSNDVTVALQRTIGLMQGELERSVLSTQLLDASTASLKSASSTHDVLDSLMVTSKHLITALEKSDWLDRLLILAGLMFFILVILFILKQRLVDRSIRIAFWWTRFIPSSSDKAMDAMEKGAIAVSATLSSVVAGVSTAAVSATASLASVTPSPLRGEAGPRESLAQPDALTFSSRDKLVSDHTTLGDPPETLLATMGTPTAIPLGHDEL